MLTKLSCEPIGMMPVITKKVNGADASARGAFARGEKIEFTVAVPRALGASAVVLRICKDREEDRDLPLSFTELREGTDYYALTLDTAQMCEEEGLFFYEFLFLRGWHTLFTDTQNQVDYTVCEHSARRFALLIYAEDYKTPEWFYGKTMYHVFVDRFYRGEGAVACRDDVILNEDWENGIPQYPKKNGDALANNMFFGGNLWGVAEKLDYLSSLGVGVIYLSPIFRAYSNHKYDTGDYMEIDGMFGGREAFDHLIEKAKKYGIRIILDGVFNHTGDNSRYFDRYGAYGNHGAYGDPSSPYRDWFCFKQYPLEYETWWGIQILPKLNPNSESARRFLVGEGGVAEHYVKAGIGGWRLDVADELSNAFLDQLRATVKAASDSQAVIIGEVWENATLKEAYGNRRRYFGGKQLDSVMNYPLRNGILHYLAERDCSLLADTLKEIYALYPKSVCDSLMNLLGTHDTERILTVLGDENREDESNDVLAHKRLTPEQKERGIAKLKLAAAMQYTVYGVPSLFYGDEAGLEGYHDPFCRRPYPWHDQNGELLDFYRKLGRLRREHSVLADGRFAIEHAEGALLCYTRKNADTCLRVIVNASEQTVSYPSSKGQTDALSGERYEGKMPPMSVRVLINGGK